MKRFNISILFALLLLCVSAVKGQSVVSDVLNHSSDTTIVRYWKNGISIVYTHNEDDENWFLLVDTVVPNALRIAVPPAVTVNDFRIFHDTVFLGGNHVDVVGAKRGLLACFAINDFYSGAGYYHWGVALATPMPDIFVIPYVHNQICDILGLAVYDSSGYSKIAFIARNLIEGDSWQRVGVGCARYDGTSWNGMFLYNKYGREEYTDIVSTENHVVAVARTNDSTCLALRVYPKSNFIYPTGPYPTDFFYPNKDGQGLCDLQVDNDVMAGISVSCGVQNMIQVDRTTPTLNTTSMQTNMNKPSFQFGKIPFEVEEIERRIICN